MVRRPLLDDEWSHLKLLLDADEDPQLDAISDRCAEQETTIDKLLAELRAHARERGAE